MLAGFTWGRNILHVEVQVEVQVAFSLCGPVFAAQSVVKLPIRRTPRDAVSVKAW